MTKERLASKFAQILGRVTLGLIVLMTFLPFYLLIINSFKWQQEIIINPWILPVEWRFINYSKAFSQILRPLFNTVIVTAATIFLTIAVSTLAGYSFARYQFKGSKLLYVGIIAMLMIPSYVLLIPQFIQIQQLGLHNTYFALIFPPTAYSVAMGTALMRTSMESIDKSLLEVAELEGATEMVILWKIVVPLTKATMATIMIMTGLSAWNNYLWPLVASTGEKTLQISVALTKIIRTVTEGQGVQFAGYVLAALPLVILFAFSSKYFVAGITQGAVKG